MLMLVLESGSLSETLLLEQDFIRTNLSETVSLIMLESVLMVRPTCVDLFLETVISSRRFAQASL